MHEMSLVRNIVGIVLEEAEAAKAAEVKKVHIVVGEGRDIVVDLFESLFRFLARGTIAANAEIKLEHVPYMVECKQCGTQFHLITIDQSTWTCPNCHSFKNYKLVSGMEFYISKIEASKNASISQKEEKTDE